MNTEYCIGYRHTDLRGVAKQFRGRDIVSRKQGATSSVDSCHESIYN